MHRALYLLIAAAAIASAPLPALAQAWPTAVVASAPRLTTPSRVPALIMRRDMIAPSPVGAPSTQAERRALKLDDGDDAGDIPEIEVRAKAEWSDDQGLRVGPTRVAYKSRF
ncbi:MAG: hypothetical protein EPO51_22685 [Phenylobacterium sp.]|uniref:hypothetical protein n=1 Tax=Phenylobacterium sp. TaxID=1871053 RepID=UPI001215E80E|nr:hypothetical protein [Phenylobacterium sp.]TAJ69527.1 MAG: hypothetical protein EPO51_22685 [Phenylobacterium sp.]